MSEKSVSSPLEGPFIGFIPDGNRRSEYQRLGTTNLTPEQYYIAYSMGAEVVKDVINEARDNAVGIITVWGLSTENLKKRPKDQLQELYKVYADYLIHVRDKWMHELQNKDVRFVHLGRRDGLEECAPHVLELIDEVSRLTKDRMGMIVGLCLDYDGLEEQGRAIDLWQKAGSPDGVFGWKQFLDLPRQCPVLWDKERKNVKGVDLIVRTGENVNEEPVHDNEYLIGYRDNTRFDYPPELLLRYSGKKFRSALQQWRSATQRRGA